jgi:hypothetical protein
VRLSLEQLEDRTVPAVMAGPDVAILLPLAGHEGSPSLEAGITLSGSLFGNHYCSKGSICNK